MEFRIAKCTEKYQSNGTSSFFSGQKISCKKFTRYFNIIKFNTGEWRERFAVSVTKPILPFTNVPLNTYPLISDITAESKRKLYVPIY